MVKLKRNLLSNEKHATEEDLITYKRPGFRAAAPRLNAHVPTQVGELTWVHPADFLYEGLVKTCDYGAAYWNHEVLVQALNKGIDPSNTSPLIRDQNLYCAVNLRRPDSAGTGAAHLLDEVHALGRLHSVGVVNYMRNVVFGTQSCQLLDPADKV